MEKYLPVEIKELEDKLEGPPFLEPSIILVDRALMGDDVEVIEALSPYLHAIASIRLSNYKLKVEIMVSPLPATHDKAVVKEWREIVNMTVRMIELIKELASIKAKQGEAIIYKLEMPIQEEWMEIPVSIISIIRSIAGLQPIESPIIAKKILELDEDNTPRRKALYDALFGIETLAMIELEEDPPYHPGSFTLSIIQDVLEMPRSTTYRLLEDLVNLKFLVKVNSKEGRGYYLNMRYEPVVGHLMPISVEIGRKQVLALLKMATGKDWKSYPYL